jgi:cell wall assembly regulator SMI1
LLDLDPAEGGTKGQIIYQFHDDLFRSVEACSFREWMELYVTDLENGKYRVTRDQEGWPQMERTDDEW